MTNHRRPRRLLTWTACACLLLLRTPGVAAQPDAGQILQEQQRAVPQSPGAAGTVNIQSTPREGTPAGGATVTIRRLVIDGATLISSDELVRMLALPDLATLDLAGLRELAERISDHYRARGFPFARAYLPAQSLSEGVLRINVLEGRYGQVQASGDASEQAQAFLRRLQPGQVIESQTLERVLLTLDDLPGFTTAPIIRPGQALGTGDLDVRMVREPGAQGQVGLDNHGNRYTGAHRARFDVEMGSPFLIGDQLQLRGLVSDENLSLGSVQYGVPLGVEGTRAAATLSRTTYDLGKEFAALGSTGTARTLGLTVSHPLVRSQRRNLSLGLGVQRKKLLDKEGLTSTGTSKVSQAMVLTSQFDLRDRWMGGGLSYGVASWTVGRLKLDDVARVADAQGPRTEGRFGRLNLDIVRLQSLPAGWVLQVRASAQWTRGNLDSSEGFSIGGPDGVRAYPTGEGQGDSGWLSQIELRLPVEPFAPFLFHDAGRVRVNQVPWDDATNTRALAGAGVGLRSQGHEWTAQAALAWRSQGGAAQSEPSRHGPRAWVSLSRRL